MWSRIVIMMITEKIRWKQSFRVVKNDIKVNENDEIQRKIRQNFYKDNNAPTPISIISYLLLQYNQDLHRFSFFSLIVFFLVFMETTTKKNEIITAGHKRRLHFILTMSSIDILHSWKAVIFNTRGTEGPLDDRLVGPSDETDVLCRCVVDRKWTNFKRKKKIVILG